MSNETSKSQVLVTGKRMQTLDNQVSGTVTYKEQSHSSFANSKNMLVDPLALQPGHTLVQALIKAELNNTSQNDILIRDQTQILDQNVSGLKSNVFAECAPEEDGVPFQNNR